MGLYALVNEVSYEHDYAGPEGAHIQKAREI